MQAKTANEDSGASQTVDVCVIGAGWSGLLAARHMLEEGLSVIVLEARDGLGGIWRCTDDPTVASVMQTTITSSSACVTEASDFPFDLEVGNFVHHRDILAWMHRYADHFDLTPRIRFGRRVQQARRRDGGWWVEAGDLTVSARFLVVSSGQFQRPRDDIAELRGFTGDVQHAIAVKSIPADRYRKGDRVLVYGGGETAADVVELLAATDADVTWSIPDGQHFFRKAYYFDRKGPARFGQHDSPLDEASSRAIQLLSPFERAKPGMQWLCVVGSTGTPLGYEGHGVPQWYKGVPFMHAFANKNGHIVEHVHEGRVTPQGKVEGAAGDRVRFADGASERFTHVILCTGYINEFPFLPDALRRPIHQRYKLMFDPDEPTVAFLGYARPNVGSIPMMTEPQAFLAARVFSGRVKLPDRAGMLEAIEADEAERDAYFCGRRRPNGLVHCFTYGYDISRLAGIMPSYRRLLAEDPVAFAKSFFSPSNAALFRLHDPATRRQAADQMWRRQKAKYFLLPWVYVASRGLAIDPLMHLGQRIQRRWQGRHTGHGAPRGSMAEASGP